MENKITKGQRFFDHLHNRELKSMKHYEKTSAMEAVRAKIGTVKKGIFLITKLSHQKESKNDFRD